MPDKTFLIEKSNIKIDSAICRTYLEKPKNDTRLKIDATKGVVIKAFKDLDECKIFEDLNAPLKKCKLSIRIKLVIWEDDFWLKFLAVKGEIGALTFGGDPITINIQLSAFPDLSPVNAMKVLIHELMHAQENAYEEAGKKVPYGGHSSKKWNTKQAELIKIVEGKLKKTVKSTPKEIDDFLKEQGLDDKKKVGVKKIDKKDKDGKNKDSKESGMKSTIKKEVKKEVKKAVKKAVKKENN